MRAPVLRPPWVAGGLYLLMLLAFLLEKAGQTTTDTKAALMTNPGDLLSGTFSLWNPEVSLGELQNQAYGYLFPMGPFFGGLHGLGVPDWVTERLWSWLVVVVACEGARWVARELGLNPWPALAAGLVYGLNVRMVSEIGVRSAEVLPTAVLPWVLLPVLWVLRGRIGPRVGALCSGAAFLFAGAVNGTATIAPLPLVVIVIVWACRRGLARWSFLGWWSGAIAVVSVWWAASLVQLSGFSPPFFDYVEDARTTTSTAGFDAALRGASNWVGYLPTGGEPTWPAAWSLNYQPVLVVATGVIAAVSLVGLATFRSRWRTPLILGALFGLTCLTIAHTSQVWLQSPAGPTVQGLLDSPFALLRNIAKVDPVLRLPLAIGFGAAIGRLADLRAAQLLHNAPRRAAALRVTLVAASLLIIASAQPIWALNTRTPGWEKVPDYWTQTANFLDDQPGQNGAWVVPGSGFGNQVWGWTIDEPMSMVARTPWVTRSQVPLVEAETIRMLISLEDVLDTGSGSAELGQMLQRIGLGYVVLRHDLDPALVDSSPSNVVSIALSRSSGVRRVAAFGNLGLGPAIEIFEVNGRDRSAGSDLRMRHLDTVRTIASGPADVLGAVGAGLLPQDRAAVVEGDTGWSKPPQIVGDGFQLRERQFGRVHAAEGPVLAAEEPHRAVRRVENYPGSNDAPPVVADYEGARYVAASSAQGYPDSFGEVRAEDAPYAAVDGDDKTGWTSGFLTRPQGQWLEVRYDAAQTFGRVAVLGDAITDPGVLAWRVSAGGASVLAKVDPVTGRAEADLGGARGETLRVTAAQVGGGQKARFQVGIREIEATGLPIARSLVVPATEGPMPLAFLFSSRPETRACVPTLVAPDCDQNRFRPAEEATGIDREVTFAESADWSVEGTVVARSNPSSFGLLDPLQAPVTMRGSSTYLDDPTVSPRMAYDATPTTSWIANPRDRTPVLTVEFAKPTRVDSLRVAPPSAPGVIPTVATLVSGDQVRRVKLGDFGIFEPLTTKRLEIKFENPTRPFEPLGVGEVELGPSKIAVPLDGSAPTGSFCGFGPNIFVDGVKYTTRVDGLMGDVSSSGPLNLALCGAPMPIDAGTHRIRIESTVQFQPVRVVLSRPGANVEDSVTVPGGPARSMKVVRETDTSQQVEIGPGPASLLTTSRNWNPGWEASLNGESLRPQRIDGWAQGWIIPAGSAGTIKLSFEPQAAYLIGLVGGLALAGVALMMAVVLLVRSGLRTPMDPVLKPGPRRRRQGAWGSGAAIASGAVLGGLPGLLGVAIAQVPGKRGAGRLVLAGLLVVAGAVVTAVHFLLDREGLIPDASDVLAGTGAVLALVAGLGSPDYDDD